MTTERSGSNLPVLFESNGDAVELRYDSDHETFWATRREIAGVFGCSEQNVDAHLKNIYAEREIEAEATTKKSLVVQSEGDRRVRREVTQYNLDAILSVGYRVNSAKAVKFRQWSTAKLTAFVLEGAILDEQRLSENPELLQKVAARIRQIRHSEQSIYAKIRDVFKESSSDYASDSPTARGFFAMAQDKLHYAVTQKTAAEIILERADPLKHNMGLVTVRGNSPIKAEATVGKNYLTPDELQQLENISEQFLLFAESKAFRSQPMTMEELSFRLNTLLTANDYPVLYEYKEFLRPRANAHALETFGQYNKQLKSPAPETDEETDDGGF